MERDDSGARRPHLSQQLRRAAQMSVDDVRFPFFNGTRKASAWKPVADLDHAHARIEPLRDAHAFAILVTSLENDRDIVRLTLHIGRLRSVTFGARKSARENHVQDSHGRARA
jgi:hypothetical protein